MLNAERLLANFEHSLLWYLNEASEEKATKNSAISVMRLAFCTVARFPQRSYKEVRRLALIL